MLPSFDAMNKILKLLRLKSDFAHFLRAKFNSFEFQGFKAIQFSKHLYRPLLYVNSNHIEVKPVALNQGEQEFVCDIQTYCKKHPEFFENGRELYILRNMSRGRGIGFFEAGNFYPDFILWILDKNLQRISFVDPKGIRNLQGIGDPKIAFYDTIKNIEKRLGDPNIILNSFIVSVTRHEWVDWADEITIKELNGSNVYFKENQINYIKLILDKIIK